jgi:hypothetical protein
MNTKTNGANKIADMGDKLDNAHPMLKLEDLEDGILDDSKDAILSRTVARIHAKGLVVSWVGTDGWERGKKDGVRATRTWEIPVYDMQLNEIGTVLLTEVKGIYHEKVKGIGVPQARYTHTMHWAFSSEILREALGMETAAERAERAKAESARSDRENDRAERASR